MLKRIELPEGIRAMLALQEYFGVPDNLEDILWAAFDWYFVPRSSDRIAYARRVVEAALRTNEKEGILPDWFWRVHALCIEEKTFPRGLMPPGDPKDLPPP